MPGEHDTPPEGVGEQFLAYLREPKNVGALENPSGQGAAVGQCGDSIEVHLRVDDGAIADIRVMPKGCAYTLACACAVCDLANGRDLDRALDLEPDEVVRKLGGLPEDHLHCARLAVNTLGEAIADYYRRSAEPGDDGNGTGGGK